MSSCPKDKIYTVFKMEYEMPRNKIWWSRFICVLDSIIKHTENWKSSTKQCVKNTWKIPDLYFPTLQLAVVCKELDIKNTQTRDCLCIALPLHSPYGFNRDFFFQYPQRITNIHNNFHSEKKLNSKSILSGIIL